MSRVLFAPLSNQTPIHHIILGFMSLCIAIFSHASSTHTYSRAFTTTQNPHTQNLHTDTSYSSYLSTRHFTHILASAFSQDSWESEILWDRNLGESNPSTSPQNTQNLQSSLPQDSTTNELPLAQAESTSKSSTIPAHLYASLGFDMYMDNLEGDNALWATRTLWAVRLAPEFGIVLNNKHALMLGAYALQNMGETRFPTKANITSYYAYNGERFRALAGIFPRDKLIGEYPLAFFRKDFLFFSPNTNGIALQIPRRNYLFYRPSGEIVFDWYGGNLAKRYDEFFVAFEGRFDMFHLLYLRTNALLYHIKNAELLSADNSKSPHNPALPNTQLLDLFLYNATLGLDIAEFITLDGLQKADISISALGSLERKRQISALGDFYDGSGGEFRAQLQYRGFGVDESYYFGKGQMRYFNEYGESVYNGLPFYQADSLNRLSVYYEYKNSFLRVYAGFGFYAFNSTLATQQMLTLTLDTHKAFAKMKM